VVVPVLLQWHHVVARVIAGAWRSLRSENPVLSEIEKLIPDNHVICQTGKPDAALSRVAHAFFVGDHGECPPGESSNGGRRGSRKQLIKGSASTLTEKKMNCAGMTYSRFMPTEVSLGINQVPRTRRSARPPTAGACTHKSILFGNRGPPQYAHGNRF